MNSPIPDDWISAWLDGELSAEERRRFEAELEEDEELRLKVEAYQQLSERLRRLPTHRLPASFAADVVEQVAATQRSSAPSHRDANGSSRGVDPPAPITRTRSWYIAMGAVASLAAALVLAMAFPLWFPQMEAQISLLEGKVERRDMPTASSTEDSAMSGDRAPSSPAMGLDQDPAVSSKISSGDGANALYSGRSDGATDQAPALMGSRSGSQRRGAEPPRGPRGLGGSGAPGNPGGVPSAAAAGGLGAPPIQGGGGRQSLADPLAEMAAPGVSSEGESRAIEKIGAGIAGAIIGQAVDRALRDRDEPMAAESPASGAGAAPGQAFAPGAAGSSRPESPSSLPSENEPSPAPSETPVADSEQVMSEEEESQEAAAPIEISEALPATDALKVPAPFAVLMVIDTPEVFTIVDTREANEGPRESGAPSDLASGQLGSGLGVPVPVQMKVARAESEADVQGQAAAENNADVPTPLGDAVEQAPRVRVFEIVGTSETIGVIADRLRQQAAQSWELRVQDEQVVWSARESDVLTTDAVGGLQPREPQESLFRGAEAIERGRLNQDESSRELRELSVRELVASEASAIVGPWLEATETTELTLWTSDSEAAGEKLERTLAPSYRLVLGGPVASAQFDASAAEAGPIDREQQQTLWLIVPVIEKPVDAAGEDAGEKQNQEEVPADREPSQQDVETEATSQAPTTNVPGEEDGVPSPMPSDDSDEPPAAEPQEPPVPLPPPTEPMGTEPTGPEPAEPSPPGEPSEPLPADPMPEPSPEAPMPEPPAPSVEPDIDGAKTEGDPQSGESHP